MDGAIDVENTWHKTALAEHSTCRQQVLQGSCVYSEAITIAPGTEVNAHWATSARLQELIYDLARDPGPCAAVEDGLGTYAAAGLASGGGP